MPTPWYLPGVAFRCKGPECGDCCSGKHGPGAVWVNDAEIAALAAHVGLSVAEFTLRHVRALNGHLSLRERPNNDCEFYEAGKGCTVYASRPAQCRTYPFWGKTMAARWRWDSEAGACPGIGVEGATVTAGEIEAQLAADRERFPEGRPPVL